MLRIQSLPCFSVATGLLAPQMSASSGKKRTRQVYTSEQKAEVIAFVNNHNSENGRGGQATAATKFGISPITVSSWLKVPTEKAPKASKVTQYVKPSLKQKAAAISPVSRYTAKIEELIDVAKQIDRAESELAGMKLKFNNLTSSL